MNDLFDECEEQKTTCTQSYLLFIKDGMLYLYLHFKNFWFTAKRFHSYGDITLTAKRRYI